MKKIFLLTLAISAALMEVASQNTNKSLELLGMPPSFAPFEGQIRGNGYKTRIVEYATKDFTQGRGFVETSVFVIDTVIDNYAGCGLNFIDDITNKDGYWEGSTYRESTGKQWFLIPQSADTIIIGGLPYAYAGKKYWTQWKELSITPTSGGCTIERWQEYWEPTALHEKDGKELEKLYGTSQGLPALASKRLFTLKGMPEVSLGKDPKCSVVRFERSITGTKKAPVVNKWYQRTAVYKRSEILAKTGMTEQEFCKAATYQVTKIVNVDGTKQLETLATEIFVSGNKYTAQIYYNGVPSQALPNLTFAIDQNRGVADLSFRPVIQWVLYNDYRLTDVGYSWSSTYDPAYPNEIILTPGPGFKKVGLREAIYTPSGNQTALVLRCEFYPMTQKGVQYQRSYDLRNGEQETYHKLPGKPQFVPIYSPFG